MTNFGLSYDLVEGLYGFDAAEKMSVKDNEGIFTVPSFPFAHLGFRESETDKLNYFLKNINENYGDEFPEKMVPYTISQGFDGFLVSIAKDFREKGIGSGNIAGHIVVETPEEFDSITYNDCLNQLSQRLFKIDELNLLNFL